MKVGAAFAAPAKIPLPTIRPAVAVTIAATAAATVVSVSLPCSLSVENVSTLTTGRERAEFGRGTRNIIPGP